jgi:hypothetical protein
MVRLTCLPKQVVNWLHVLRPMFRHRHHLVFCARCGTRTPRRPADLT